MHIHCTCINLTCTVFFFQLFTCSISPRSLPVSCQWQWTPVRGLQSSFNCWTCTHTLPPEHQEQRCVYCHMQCSSTCTYSRLTTFTIHLQYRSLHTHNSSLEGAMELKFVPFCSSCDALLPGIIIWQSQNFQNLAENHGL